MKWMRHTVAIYCRRSTRPAARLLLVGLLVRFESDFPCGRLGWLYALIVFKQLYWGALRLSGLLQ